MSRKVAMVRKAAEAVAPIVAKKVLPYAKEHLVDLVVAVLTNNLIPFTLAQIARLIEEKLDSGVSAAAVPGLVLEEIGHGELASVVGKNVKSKGIRVECPVNNGPVEVLRADTERKCPTCGLTITVKKGRAIHPELLVYACPISTKDSWLEPESDAVFICPECGLEILVRQNDGYWSLLHQLQVR